MFARAAVRRAADRVQRRVRRLLRRAQGRHGAAGARLRPPPPASRTPLPHGLRVRRTHARARARRCDHGRDADRLGPAPGEDALRAGVLQRERRHLERGAPRRHARRAAGPLRVRGRGRASSASTCSAARRAGAIRRSSAAARTRRSCTTRARSRQMQAGELLLVDAAANYQGMTVDITRAYPVSGQFSRRRPTLAAGARGAGRGMQGRASPATTRPTSRRPRRKWSRRAC